MQDKANHPGKENEIRIQENQAVNHSFLLKYAARSDSHNGGITCNAQYHVIGTGRKGYH